MDLQIDRKYFARESAPYKIEIAKGDGCFLITPEGDRYIDLTCGWGVGNYGWSNREIEGKLKKFDGPSYVSPHFLYERWAELARTLAEITPGRLKKCFRATGGTEAVELGLQAAMLHTKREKFVSLADAYHGNSIATRLIGSPPFGDWYRNPIIKNSRLKPPLDERALDRAERLLNKRDVAAVIMEPIVLSLNVLIPEKAFMKGLQALCRKYGTLLIMDEVATGFGRTGKVFATEHYDLEPDIMCLGKALTGGFAAMGATVMTEPVAKTMERDGSFYSTFGWHPRSTEAAIASVEYLRQNQDKLLSHAETISDYICSRLKEMTPKQEPKVRACGLAIGVEYERSDAGEKITEKARKHGLLLSGGGNGFTVFPALTMSTDVAREAMDRLEDVVRSVVK